MTLLLAFALPFVPFASAVCEEECSTIISRLSSCNLDPLSTDADIIQKNQQSRNVTGLPETEYHAYQGPPSYSIASLSQAECFCTDATREYETCDRCITQSHIFSGDWEPNEAEVLRLYGFDCSNFGYFVNQTVAYPSTTLTTMPEATSATSSDTSCDDICSLINVQAVECGLPSLDDADYDSEDSLIIVPSENGDYNGHLLPNRPTAECMCTVPVLRRLDTCYWCQNDLKGGLSQVLSAYRLDCNALGYWPTQSLVVPDKAKQTDSDQTSQNGGGSDPPASSDRDEPGTPDSATRDGGHIGLRAIYTAGGAAALLSLLT